MSVEQNDDNTVYRVVLNDEEQYSIWWAHRDLPAGWHAEGTEGTRDECLARIGDIWTDMRPLSLRRRMEGQHTAV
ncbi:MULTISPECIES: MbtH family NRPS accessory protein [Streptomyces]|uniref:MbtH family NRPS accessory protein n=1 Tax=Streptomyces mordarskii TaxID=1226758 RepID=A0ABP3MS41_9ACTN|nr:MULTISPECIES: MbtH family NRPS accessory protein [Streptomyces]ASQ93450.1 antibiotic synthesis protein MbtH [Streptomyces sp. 11-1-2]QTI89589.1 MbtH family NRPS accessory protein [Streptomyces sp. AgN23]RSS48941.1 antibiotic synthesis protein MbtH [Streptomyces sp. WAC05858]WTA80474.1 MbtH family NRPS accessory protein [Streptomyces antimycoticus]WTB04807.1 MbtH family NRPS accessory protein [Streptomyces antimycoticus]